MTCNFRAPFPWFGGKSRAADLIWARLGDVGTYVEPFAGSLAVLLSRPTLPRIETVNDLDAHLSNFWRAMKADAERVAHFADWPVSEADLHARHRALIALLPAHRARMLAEPDYFDARLAGWWVWGVSQWIGGGWCSERVCWGDDSRPERRRPNVTGNTHGMGVHAKRPAVAADSPGRGVHARAPLGILAAPHREQSPLVKVLGGTGVHGTRVDSLIPWFLQIQARLRRVRVCCGDWRRVLTPSVLIGNGVTGIVLDPPYSTQERDPALYACDGAQISQDVCAWALEHGDTQQLRIALCGYEGEHDMPPSWSCVAWRPGGGYGSQSADGRGRRNRERERIWFSPHCLQPDRGQLSFAPLLEAAAPEPERVSA